MLTIFCYNLYVNYIVTRSFIMKKRFLALTLAFAIVFTSLLSLFSCGEKYEPVESTKEEKATVINISYEKEKYKVPYELYRAFFLQYKSVVDGGDETVWTGTDKERYEKAADELIYQRIAEIYAVFHLCEKADIDVYSNSFEKEIDKSIEATIEADVNAGGFGGDYGKYLESLKKMNHNYSSAKLMLRYHIARQSLLEHYVGTLDTDDIDGDSKPGTITYTKEDVLAFYLDDNASRRIIEVKFPEHLTEKEAEQKRDALAALAANPDKSLTDIIIYIANNTLTNPTSEVIGKFTYDTLYYADLTKSAFAVDEGEVSELFALKTTDFNGYEAVYRLPKDTDFFEESYEDIRDAYVLHKFGETVTQASLGISEVMTATDTLNELDRSKVSMN